MSAKKMTVEAYGTKGMKNTSWRKSFASYEALHAWTEKNDATVQATRSLVEEVQS